MLDNESLDRTNHFIKQNIADIANVIGVTPLFGAATGSISLHLANDATSDMDMFLVTKENPEKLWNVIKKSEGVKLDVWSISIDELMQVCDSYAAKKHNYPTILSRTKEETEKIKLVKHFHERPDFKREMTMRIFMPDALLEFYQGSVAESYEKLHNGLKLIDIWDAHYNRIYGNYHEKIKEDERIAIRKYLYTISEISICKQLTMKIRPNMNFTHIFDCTYYEYGGARIREMCRELWQRNKTGALAKENMYTDAKPDLNDWIGEMLVELLEEMKQNYDYLSNHYLTLGGCEYESGK